jgi:hypothetical protein
VQPGFSGSFAESTYIRRSDVKVRFEIVGATGVFSGSGSGKRHPAISVRSKATLEELGRVWKKRYPGEYDDIDDFEVGRSVKEVYPDQLQDVVGSLVEDAIGKVTKK